MGSDGVFDNLEEPHIQRCLKPQLHSSSLDLKNIQMVSDCISTQAEIFGYDPKYDSPFAKEARAHKKNHPGGKSDDITVIVAQVKME